MNFSKTLTAAVAGCLVLCSSSAFAAPVTIDFDQNISIYSTNPVSQFQDASGAVTGTIKVQSTTEPDLDQAWLYDTSPNGATLDPDLEGPFFNAEKRTPGDSTVGLTSLDFGYALVIQEHANSGPDDDAKGGVVTFEFDNLVTLFSVDLLDASLDKNGVTFKLFDESGNSLLTDKNDFDGDSNGAPNWYETVVFNGAAGISEVKSLEVHLNSVSGAIDNIVVAPVPIPAAAWLFASALGLFGYLGKRKAKT